MITIYGQRDARWAQMKLGSSPCTMAKYGCLTTDISILTTCPGFGPIITPDRMCKIIKYTPDGLVIWSSVDFQGFKFERKTGNRDDAVIQQYLKDPNKAVILEVDNTHWVLALSKNLFGGYNIADPYFGDKATTRRYKTITNCALFVKK